MLPWLTRPHSSTTQCLFTITTVCPMRPDKDPKAQAENDWGTYDCLQRWKGLPPLWPPLKILGENSDIKSELKYKLPYFIKWEIQLIWYLNNKMKTCSWLPNSFFTYVLRFWFRGTLKIQRDTDTMKSGLLLRKEGTYINSTRSFSLRNEKHQCLHGLWEAQGKLVL